jgi:hypothetical protein
MPKKYLIWLLLVFTLCVAAVLFYYPRPQNVQPEPWQSDKVTDTVDEMLSHYGDTRQELIRRFGEPKRITTEKIKNLHNPKVIDEIIGFVYDDIGFKIYKGDKNIRDFIYEVNIFSSKYPLKNGLRVGDGKEKILATLGKPAELSSENLIYDGTLSRINFQLKNGVVDKIYVERFID